MGTTGTATAVIEPAEGGLAAGLGPDLGLGRFAPYAHRSGTSGLALDLPARLLDREFGRGRVVRFEEVDFPATLTHEPTRRFLRETGLPEDGRLFRLDTDVPLPTLAEYHADEYGHDAPGYGQSVPPAGLPDRAHHLIRLGRLAGDGSPVVDGATGRVWNWNESRAILHPLEEDVSTLAHSLWLLHRTLGGRGAGRPCDGPARRRP